MSIRALAAVSSRTISLGSALVGMLAWGIGIVLLQPGWAEALCLFAALVLVPLGLGLLAATDPHIRLRMVVVGQLPAALLLLAAFALPPGPLAALRAIPWLLLTALLALEGLIQAWRWKQRTPDELCRYAGMAYLAVGGGWALLSRAGMRPLEFSDIIVLATAVHFHYAGFVLPLLVGQAARAVPGRMAGMAIVGVVAGVPLTAVGITLSAFDVRWPEWLAVWFLAATCVVAAVLQLRAVWRLAGMARGVLILSALALIGGMALAAVYALGGYWGTWRLEIPEMVRWHGAVNAFGFGLLGLLGWNLAASGEPKRPERAVSNPRFSQGANAPRSPHVFAPRS